MTKILVDSELLEEAADALAMFNKKLQPQVNGADESCFTIGLKQQVTFGQMVAAAQAHDNLRAALDAPSVPEGWQLVPKEPTREMLHAGWKEGWFSTQELAIHYKAMLSAAPKAPTTDDRKDAERWRYIRRHLCLTGNGDGTCQMYALNLPCRIQGWPEIGESLQFHDAAIDSAIAAQKGEKE